MAHFVIEEGTKLVYHSRMLCPCVVSLYRRRETMFASTLPTATTYYSVHGKLFIARLHAWLPFTRPQVTALFGNPELTEAACIECDALALRTLQAQFPAPSTGM